MVGLLVKVKSKDISNLMEWNKTTFNIRKSLGLQGIRAYRATKLEDEYYVFSVWDNIDNMHSYINDPNTKQILSNSVIEWFTEIEDFPEANLGDIKL